VILFDMGPGFIQSAHQRSHGHNNGNIGDRLEVTDVFERPGARGVVAEVETLLVSLAVWTAQRTFVGWLASPLCVVTGASTISLAVSLMLIIVLTVIFLLVLARSSVIVIRSWFCGATIVVHLTAA
jgi:hypothetical protein